MNLAELIQQFRIDAFDLEQPYLFSDDEVTRWLNAAEKEAAIRGRLIHEAVNPLVCTIEVLPNVSVYPLHEAVYEIEYICLFIILPRLSVLSLFPCFLSLSCRLFGSSMSVVYV